jgi:long-chain acyl-CoA synthetase
VNIASWLERAGRSYPELPAIAHGHETVSSYARLAARCAGLAGALRGRYGLSPGDRVVLAAKNHPDYLETLFGIWWAGLVAVPVNAKLHASEISWIIENADAPVVFVSGDLEASLGALELRNVTELVALGAQQYESHATHDPAAVTPRQGEDLAWLFYTSGTTGRPKGVMLTHRNLSTMSLAYLAEVDPTGPGDSLLHAAPMSHGSGLYAIPHVCRGALNVVSESGGFHAAEVLELVGARKRTSFFAAPTMIRRLVDSPADINPQALRTLIWGGAPMHVPDVIRALDRFGPRLAQVYGQGETPMTISVLSRADVSERAHPRWLHRLGSAGIPNPAVEVQVADAAGAAVPAGQTGEVLVRGDTVMRGYWNDPAASAATLRGGWLHTGDIGSFDGDGYLTLLDRANDLIISGGSNIYPREVEEVLAEHPRVREVSVIGRPDPEWGEIVIAYVVGEVDAVELDLLCLGRIARFKRPKDYIFVPSLPKSNYGKILKADLRALDQGVLAESRVAARPREDA